MEKVNLFKSLSIIEEEEIYRIQKNLNNHRDQIKDNELDAIVEDDYSSSIESQNIPHTKKMLFAYFKGKIVFLYILPIAILVVSAFSFLISDSLIAKKGNI
jgi:hypothetical protein